MPLTLQMMALVAMLAVISVECMPEACVLVKVNHQQIPSLFSLASYSNKEDTHLLQTGRHLGYTHLTGDL